jgi:hypothetical protein
MILLACIHNLKLVEPTGRGIQISDGIYLTNECTTYIKRMLSRPFMQAMGGMEAVSLLTGPATVYWKDVPNEPDPVQAVETLTAWLHYLRGFFMALWVVKDNAVNCEIGFLEHDARDQGLTHASNFIAALFTNARGLKDEVDFRLTEIRQAREYFWNFFLPGMSVLQVDRSIALNLPLKPRSTVVSAKGVPRLTRFLYFLAAARGANDLGVKVSLYMTCLEIMFSTESSELTHRLSERVAFFLRREPTDRFEVYKALRRAYDIRSKVVHGSVMSEQKQRGLNDVAGEIDELLRELVLRMITDEASRKVLDLSDTDFELYFARLTMGFQ